MRIARRSSLKQSACRLAARRCQSTSSGVSFVWKGIQGGSDETIKFRKDAVVEFFRSSYKK